VLNTPPEALGSGMRATRSRARRVALGAAVGVAGALGAAALASGLLTVLVARAVIVPPSRRTEDVRVVRVDLEHGVITLSATPDSLLPGTYSFWFDQDAGAARLGEIVARDERTVTRRVLSVEFGDLEAAPSGRFNGWVYLTPDDLATAYEDVAIRTPLGDAPAWLVPADPARASKRWMIGVHGRAVRRSEVLRAVPVFRDAGYDSLIVSYRNDGEAPRSADYRYALGDREWIDVEEAMRYALDHGAEELVLMGWSMGGATVLQALTRSLYREHVVGVVLESPVVDWIATLDFQVTLRRLPAVVRYPVLAMFRSRWGGILTGLAEPLDLDRMDFVRRARELNTPILLLHSDDDGFVPSTASRALAVARPDIVTFVPFDVARHTKLWNYDPERWEGAIRAWLKNLA
jgi:alpha-beta hydrolase superfamily lysophospholipase